MNQQIKLNLTRLTGSFVHDLKGGTGTVKKCLVIPLQDSGLVIEDKSVYLYVAAFELENKKGQSHICKLKLSADEYHTLTEQQRNDLPIIGGIKPFGAKPMEATNDFHPAPSGDESTDLPV